VAEKPHYADVKFNRAYVWKFTAVSHGSPRDSMALVYEYE